MSRPGTLSHQEPISLRTSGIHSRLRGAEVIHSVCPYCAIRCGLLVFTKGKRPIAIEGNPDSPVNQGRLCPKGANTLQLVANPHRVITVKYRAPHSDRWEDRPLDWAKVPIEESSTKIESALPLDFLDSAPNPEDSCLDREQEQILSAALNKLRPGIRKALSVTPHL